MDDDWMGFSISNLVSQKYFTSSVRNTASDNNLDSFFSLLNILRNNVDQLQKLIILLSKNNKDIFDNNTTSFITMDEFWGMLEDLKLYSSSFELKTLPSDLKIGSYICFKPAEIYCRIRKIIPDGFETDGYVDGHNCFPNKYLEDNFEIVSGNHLKVLKKFNPKQEIVSILLAEPIKRSILIIEENGYSATTFEQLESQLVPDILTPEQWIQWKKRVRTHFKQVSTDAKESDITEQFIVLPQDFIVCVQKFNCSHKNHSLIPIDAEILTRNPSNKNITSLVLPAGYCEKCNNFYILSSVYEAYSHAMENALCDIVNERNLSRYLEHQEKLNLNGQLASKSILMKCGYSVGSKDGLSQRERIKLLSNIIEYGILSIEEIKGFLNWLIEFNKNNPNQETAIEKWKSDLFKISSLFENKKILVKRIIIYDSIFKT